MKKRLDPDTALRAVELLDKNGINTQCTFVVGFPGECAESIERTAALISAFPSGKGAGAIHRYYLFPFQVFPLSPVVDPRQREDFGLKGMGQRWSHKTMDSEEAGVATRELFMKVQGASHMYLEFIPPDWSIGATREVMARRDSLQKSILRAEDVSGGMEDLLKTVRQIDRNTTS